MQSTASTIVRLSVACFMLGMTWFLTVANSNASGPVQLGIGSYEASSNCSVETMNSTIEVGQCDTATSDPDSPPCVIDVETTFAALGIEGAEAPDPYSGNVITGTVQGAEVRCEHTYYAELETFVYECLSTTGGHPICVITLTAVDGK